MNVFSKMSSEEELNNSEKEKSGESGSEIESELDRDSDSDDSLGHDLAEACQCQEKIYH